MAPSDTTRLRVVFFQRRPYPTGMFSLEAIFADVRARLAQEVDARLVEASFYSRGLFKRLAIALGASFRQGDVNVVAGDIHFAALFLRQRKTLLMIPDCGFLHDSTGFRRWVQHVFWLSLPVRRSARVVTISEHCREEILAHAPCDPAKVAVIPVPVAKRFVLTPRPFRKERPVLLQVGQAANKNIPRIIEAIRGQDVKLVLIGELSPDNARLLREAGIHYEARCGLSDAEVVQAYVDCDLLVFPSTYEGFGMPIVEAQAVGRPVVTSNVASMPWVAGGAACLVDPFSVDSIREGILKVLGDEAYRQDLVEKGRRNVQRFQPETIARQYLEQIRMIQPIRPGVPACAP